MGTGPGHPGGVDGNANPMDPMSEDIGPWRDSTLDLERGLDVLELDVDALFVDLQFG